MFYRIGVLILGCSLFKIGICQINDQLDPSCESPIYCYGDVLHTVQTLKIFSDQKTFVDLVLNNPEQTIIDNFNALKVKDKPSIKQFVSDNFLNCSDPASQCEELEKWDPPDWTERPSIVNKIKPVFYKRWAMDLNQLWKDLGRIMKPRVKSDPTSTSLIYAPNGFIVPGGRFRELYYWDTYWIVNGLLVCDMQNTAKGVIENLLSFVKKRGHIPNGSRVYFWKRSQPPMLSLMVDSYYQRSKDKKFIVDNIELLDKEMQYFLSNRRVSVTLGNEEYQMFRYFSPSSGPRPESYDQDYTLAANLATEEEKQQLYINLKSAAESGWDFSSRWFIKNGTNNGTLIDIKTEHIIPVDLNALLHRCFVLLSDWYKNISPDDVKQKFYEKMAQDLQIAIDNVLWNEKDGIWYDYDTLNNKPRNYFYLSNFAPLWTLSYDKDVNIITEKVIQYLERNAIFRYIGGTPTSLTYSNEQWDFPNAWAPLQAFLIQGLEKTCTPVGLTWASHLAETWLLSNYRGFMKYHKMFEKYDATSLGSSGSGGEYEGQDGFGWTNGFIFELLEQYGSDYRLFKI